jgi:hypothetical protein
VGPFHAGLVAVCLLTRQFFPASVNRLSGNLTRPLLRVGGERE